MATCLVVGGSGYVGRELVRHLADEGDEVYVLNRSPRPASLPGSWLQADITDARTVAETLAPYHFDVIHHLASLPGDTGNPVQMVQVNVVGLTNLLDYARQAHVSRFVLASSISAYEWYPATRFNPPVYLPVDEEHPTRPKDMYSSSKRMQELLAMTFFHQYELPVTILRLTAVVGPHGRGGGRGWRTFGEMLAEGKRVQIPHFSFEEVCHYVDYRDVARLHRVAGNHPAAVGQIFNCCGPTATSGNEFAAAVRRVRPEIEVEVGFPWSMAQGGKVSFDMSKAAKLLGFTPIYSLEDSVRSIWEWVREGGLVADEQEKEGFAGGVKM